MEEKVTGFFFPSLLWLNMKIQRKQCRAAQYASELKKKTPHVICGVIGWECPRGQSEKYWLAHPHVQAVLGSVHTLQLLKVFPGISNVDESGCRCWANRGTRFFFIIMLSPFDKWTEKHCLLLLTNWGIWHDDHDVCVGGEDVNEGRKVGVSHFHALERGCKFTGIKKRIWKIRTACRNTHCVGWREGLGE